MAASPSIESSEPKFDAFLSYSRADRPMVRRIQRFLESYRPPGRSRRLKVYLDETDMRGGSLPENLSEALADSGALVVCWSDHAASSHWVTTEISQFRDLGRGNRIVVTHVAGPGPTVTHSAFAGMEPLEHDLRNGWRAWVLTPRAKLELLRLIAFLTDVDLRALRNWARRRMLRNVLIALGVAILPIVVVLSLRLPTWEPVSWFHYDQPIEPIACEVVDGKLWVATWSEAAGEHSGVRAYFVTYPDVLGNPQKQVERPQSFTLPKRALPSTMVSQDFLNNVREVLEEHSITDQLGRLVRPDVARFAQPNPGQFMYIRPFGEPEEQDIRHAAIDRMPTPETTGTFIVVYEKGNQPRVSMNRHLSPPRWQERTADKQRRTFPARGMSVAWQRNGEIWIGVPGERDNAGGLWHSPDAGKTWQRVERFRNVTSIDLRRAPNGGDETVVVAEQSFKRLRDAEFSPGSSRVEERTSDGKWISSDAPPHGSDSEIEICGTLPDGTLHVRVDRRVYQQHNRPLYRWVIDVLRPSHLQSEQEQPA